MYFLILALALVYPLGRPELASPEDADKLCPFATNLGSPAECTVTSGEGCPEASPLPFADTLVPAPFSGIGAHRSRRDPLIISGFAVPGTIHPQIHLSARDRRRTASFLPSFAGYTLEPVTASQIPKRNEKRTK